MSSKIVEQIECFHQRGTTKLVEIITEGPPCGGCCEICDLSEALIRRFRPTNIYEVCYIAAKNLTVLEAFLNVTPGHMGSSNLLWILESFLLTSTMSHSAVLIYPNFTTRSLTRAGV